MPGRECQAGWQVALPGRHFLTESVPIANHDFIEGGQHYQHGANDDNAPKEDTVWAENITAGRLHPVPEVQPLPDKLQ